MKNRIAIAALATSALLLSPAAAAEVDCAACAKVCLKKTNGKNYPDDAKPGAASGKVRHSDPEAKVQFLEAKKRDPAFGGTDLLGAIKGYRAAVKLDQKNAQYRNFLAGSLMRNGQTEEAIYNLRKAVEIVPNQPKYLVNLGYAYHRAGDESRALVAYMRALMFDSRDVRARLFAGYAMEMLGMDDEARLEFRRVLLQEPKHEGAKKALQRVDRRIGG
jgi:tetratricopeptide (TPR) repeat protein